MNTNFQNIIKKICEELNIEYKLLSKDWVIMLQQHNKTRFISGYKFDLNSHALGLILDDKYALYEVLKNNNIKVIEHHIVYGLNNHNHYATSCNNMEYLTNLFLKYNQNIVLKINNGTCGVNVEHITNLEDLKRTFLQIANKSNSLSLCPYYDIENEYRVVILDKEIKLLYKKERPIVTGNGILTIKELLDNFNPSYFQNINNEELKTILPLNQDYIYDWKFNLSRGARMSQNINPQDKKIITQMALEVANILDLGFCSIDIIKAHHEFFILEINSGVMLKNYIKQAKDGYHIAYEIYKEAILKMFKNT